MDFPICSFSASNLHHIVCLIRVAQMFEISQDCSPCVVFDATCMSSFIHLNCRLNVPLCFLDHNGQQQWSFKCFRYGRAHGITQQRRASYAARSGWHGSAERRLGSRGYSSPPLDRERGRPDRTRAHFQNPNPQFVRLNAVGPEETMDWLSALDVVKNRLGALKSHQRRLVPSR